MSVGIAWQMPRLHSCESLLAACAATGKQGKALAAKMRACMLYMDDEVMVLNKAAGMPVQSGTDLPLAVDQVLAAHFVSPEGHQPRCEMQIIQLCFGKWILSCCWLRMPASHAGSSFVSCTDHQEGL